MCGFVERNDLFELCKECVVSNDYIEIAHTFGSRVANEAELFKDCLLYTSDAADEL